MAFGDQLKRYGEGDNSTTDRMFYEDAFRIVEKLHPSNVPIGSRISVELVRQEIEKIVQREIIKHGQ